MKNTYVLLVCLLYLLCLLGCGEMDNTMINSDTGGKDVAEPVPTPESFIDRDLYPDGWVLLTDKEVAELLKIKVPHGWVTQRNREKRQRYLHALLLQQYGNSSSVRFIIEVQKNLSGFPDGEVVVIDIMIAYYRALNVIWPSETNKKSLELLLRNHMPPPEPELPHGAEILTMHSVEENRESLIKQYGDRPEIHVMVEILKKAAEGAPITITDKLTYWQAHVTLNPDDPIALDILKAYQNAHEKGLSVNTVDEQEIVNDWLNEKPDNE